MFKVQVHGYSHCSSTTIKICFRRPLHGYTRGIEGRLQNIADEKKWRLKKYTE